MQSTSILVLRGSCWLYLRACWNSECRSEKARTCAKRGGRGGGGVLMLWYFFNFEGPAGAPSADRRRRAPGGRMGRVGLEKVWYFSLWGTGLPVRTLDGGLAGSFRRGVPGPAPELRAPAHWLHCRRLIVRHVEASTARLHFVRQRRAGEVPLLGACRHTPSTSNKYGKCCSLWLHRTDPPRSGAWRAAPWGLTSPAACLGGGELGLGFRIRGTNPKK